METGKKYMEFKQNVEPTFLKNHNKKILRNSSQWF